MNLLDTLISALDKRRESDHVPRTATAPVSVVKKPGSQSKEPRTVYDVNGRPQTLGRLFNKGGEGHIYPLADNGDVLVKHYNKRTLKRAMNRRLMEKVETMRQMEKMLASDRFGWPRILVYGSDGSWLGYGMLRVEGVQMQTLCQPRLIAERLPHWSRREVVKCAKSFVDLIDYAHKNGVVVGDINPGNFLVDPVYCEVRGIDCDSYQVECNGSYYPCPVGIPMLLAPELLDGVDYSTVHRTVEQELFSVAVMLFRMLMLGLHPYSRTYGEDPVANLKSGKCALGEGAGSRLPLGPWYNVWSHLPFYMKTLFVTAFRDGHSDPSVRPSLAEWKDAFNRYENDLGKGWMDWHMVPAKPKSKAYQGSRDIER
jgi:DNA-binding helix-hairpin-helix protein with protein kinase domain